MDPQKNTDSNCHPHSLVQRKVRKGTISCWECKRRKARCERDASNAAKCRWCEKYNLACVSQAYDEPPQTNYARIEQRLNYVEDLLAQVVHEERSRNLREHSARSESEDSNWRLTRVRRTHNSRCFRPTKPQPNWTSGSRTLSPSLTLVRLRNTTAIDHAQWRTHLHSMLPPASTAAVILFGDKTPFSRFLQPLKIFQSSVSGAKSLTWFAELPHSNSHPVVFARKLFQLAIGLMQLRHNAGDPQELVLKYTLPETIQSFVEAARQVTLHDALVTSVDGLETLMLEGFYCIVNAKLADARFIFQRALRIAQRIGLTGKQSHNDTYRPEFIWYRLNNLDRSMSLQLGLGHAVATHDFAAENVLRDDAPLGRLNRVHVMVAGKIIERNIKLRRRMHEGRECNEFDDFQETQDINAHLKEAVRFLPADWWTRQPLLEGKPSEDLQQNTSKVLAQLEHNYLLLLLYQPYSVGNFCHRTDPAKGSSPDYLYGKITVLAAARFVIYVLQMLVKSDDVPAAYKSLESKAHLAVTTILLTHLDNYQNSANFLEHQRMQDLQLVGNAVSTFERMNRVTKPLTRDVQVGTFRKVLKFQTDVLAGASCSIRRSSLLPTDLGLDEAALAIPYFGHAVIKCSDPSELSC